MLVLFSTSDTCTLPDVALRLPKALPTFDFRDHLYNFKTKQVLKSSCSFF